MTAIPENTRHDYASRGNDLYETPTCVTEALIRAERLPYHIWEPAVGRGAISDVLRRAGHEVTCTDLVDWGCAGAKTGRDFLMERKPPKGVQAIVTNPPYMLANDFVRHALELVPIVYMFLRFAYMEGVGRADVLDGGQLARVLLFKNRVPMMHREGYAGPKMEASRMAFAWFVWGRDYSGPVILKRILADVPKVIKNSSTKNLERRQVDLMDVINERGVHV